MTPSEMFEGENSSLRKTFESANTPDTEWEETFDKEFGDENNHVVGNMPIVKTGTPLVAIHRAITQLLSSRDTYWKERVRKEKQKWLTAIDMEIEDMNAQGSVFEEMTDRIIAQVTTPINEDNLK